jgi:threonine 3-dehydrogenase
MKALSKLYPKPGLWLIDAPIPEVSNHDVLIKIHKTAICGTDLHIYHWDKWAQQTIPTPMIVGHEYVGEIAKIGKEVSGFNIGDRVSGEGHLICGVCRNCRAGKRHLCPKTQGVGVNRQGAFAEYLAIPAMNVFKIPNTISNDIAAIFDPFGNAVHTALSFNVTGEDVLIMGAGPIGIMAAAVCQHIGARHVVLTDINDNRLNLAKAIGIHHRINIKQQSLQDIMAQLGMQEGFDVGLEMSGQGDAFDTMIDAMMHGGKVAMLGIPAQPTTVDWSRIIFKGIEIKGIYGREMFETWYKMVTLVQSGLNLMPLITHQYPIDEFEQAFAKIQTGKAGKVILNWDNLS